jgi:hypothetical protein
MAEIIQLRELQAARDRVRSRYADHAELVRAVAIMRDNLAALAEQLRFAPENDQLELLDRVEKFVAMIRYGLQMTRKDEDAAG